MRYESRSARSTTEKVSSSFDTADNHGDTWNMASPHVLERSVYMTKGQLDLKQSWH